MISFSRIINWGRKDLFREDGNIKLNTNSTNVVWHFQPHMFNMATKGSMTPFQIFSDDNLFRGAIDKRLSTGGSCTPSGMRSALKEYKSNRSVSNFCPSIAKAVYMYFGGKLSVLDFSAGFGGRLLGAMGSENVRRYVGIDSLKENCDGLIKMYEIFKDLTKTSVSIISGLAEDELLKINESFDLVFTSPPFFDKETYSKDCHQSCVKFSDYSSWLNCWLLDVVEKSSRLLKSNGKLALWIGHSDEHNILEDFVTASCNLLTLDGVLYFEKPSNVYNRKREPIKLEKILVMSRKSR